MFQFFIKLFAGFQKLWDGSKSPLVSRILLWILANFNYAIVCIASTLHLISNFHSFFSKFIRLFQVHQLLLVSPPSSCSTNFKASGKIHVFAYQLAFFYFNSVFYANGKICIKHCVYFFQGLVDPFVSENHREFYLSDSQGHILACGYSIE